MWRDSKEGPLKEEEGRRGSGFLSAMNMHVKHLSLDG